MNGRDARVAASAATVGVLGGLLLHRLLSRTAASQEAQDALSTKKFGMPTRKAMFDLSEEEALCNHGSFGAVPKVVSGRQRELMLRVERHPDKWFRWDNWEITQQALSELSAFINAKPEDCVFVPNATTGVNAVLSSLELKAGDILLTPSTSYNACKLAIKRTAERAGASYVEFDIRLPLQSEADLLEQCRAALDRYPGARWVMFDHISSATAIRWPVEELCAMCKERGISVLIDGAHAIGQTDIDMAALEAAGCDYYTTNLHKWLFAPKGAALLWCRKALQGGLHPVVTSHESYSDNFQRRFWMQATRDDTAYLAAPRGLQVLRDFGLERVRAYNTNLLKWAVLYLEEKWGTVGQGVCPLSMNCYMATLRTPLALPKGEAERKEFEPELMRALHEEFKITAPVMTIPVVDTTTAAESKTAASTRPENRVFIRISVHVYTDKRDFERLGEAVLILARRQNTRARLSADAAPEAR